MKLNETRIKNQSGYRVPSGIPNPTSRNTDSTSGLSGLPASQSDTINNSSRRQTSPQAVVLPPPRCGAATPMTDSSATQSIAPGATSASTLADIIMERTKRDMCRSFAFILKNEFDKKNGGQKFDSTKFMSSLAVDFERAELSKIIKTLILKHLSIETLQQLVANLETPLQEAKFQFAIELARGVANYQPGQHGRENMSVNDQIKKSRILALAKDMGPLPNVEEKILPEILDYVVARLEDAQIIELEEFYKSDSGRKEVKEYIPYRADITNSISQSPRMKEAIEKAVSISISF